MADNKPQIPLLAAIGMAAGGLQAAISGIGMGKAKKDVEKEVGAIQTYTADPEIQRVLQMRQARLGMGLGAATRQILQQGLGTSQAQSIRAAQQMGRGGGLSTIGAIQKQTQRGLQQLAMQEEQAQERSRQAYEGAARLASAERARQFQSEQEKQQLKANIALEKLAARRASIAQGLGGLTGAASTAIYGGVNPFSKGDKQYGRDESDMYTGGVVRQPFGMKSYPTGISGYRTGGF